jgi:hypothetical protein
MKNSWYVSEAETSKRNFILAVKDSSTGTRGRLVISKDAVGDLDMEDGKTVAILDKFVKANTGTTVVNADGSYTTYFGFGASTRKYASVESKTNSINHTLASDQVVEIEYKLAEID